MYFERSKIKDVKKYVMKHAKSINVVRLTDDEDAFLAALESISMDKKYKQGEDINQDHLEALKPWVENAVRNLAGVAISDLKNPKNPMTQIEDPVDYLTTLTDYYYVLAMEKLGCPNIPIFVFDSNIKKTIETCALAIDNSVPKYNFSTETEFTQQRGKNAKELQKKSIEHRTAISNGHNSAKHMGELITEYQALKMRQANHGSIWRFFHKSENKARNALLKSMEKTIKSKIESVFGKKVYTNLDALNPSEIARKLADARIRGNVEMMGMYRLDSKTAEIFGQPSADQLMLQQKEIENSINNKMPMSTNEEFMADINDKKSEISEPIKENKRISKDNIILEGDNEVPFLE